MKHITKKYFIFFLFFIAACQKGQYDPNELNGLGDPFDFIGDSTIQIKNYVIIHLSQVANYMDLPNSYEISTLAKFTNDSVPVSAGTVYINSRAIPSDSSLTYKYSYTGTTYGEGKALGGSSTTVRITGSNDFPNDTAVIDAPAIIYPDNTSSLVPPSRIYKGADYVLHWNPDANNQFHKVGIQVTFYPHLYHYGDDTGPDALASLNYEVTDNGTFSIPQADLSNFPDGAYVGITIGRASLKNRSRNRRKITYIFAVTAKTIPLMITSDSTYQAN